MRIVLLLFASTLLGILANLIAGYLQPTAHQHRKLIIALFVFTLSFLLFLNLPDINGTPAKDDTFAYQVRVQAQNTQANISNAKVTIDVGENIASLVAFTDNNGVAVIQIDGSRVGKFGRLIVEAPGYKPQEQNITLTQGTLPQIIRLEAVNTPSPLASTSQSGIFQDFEDGAYCTDHWYARCSRTMSQVSQGKWALEVGAHAQADGKPEDSGGAVRIYPASGNPIDLSSASTFSVWVFDTQGNNEIELRLCNDNGCYPPESEIGVWSGSQSVQNQWTEISWDLSRFSDMDRSKITYIQLYEKPDGIYYFDSIGWK